MVVETGDRSRLPSRGITRPSSVALTPSVDVRFSEPLDEDAVDLPGVSPTPHEDIVIFILPIYTSHLGDTVATADAVPGGAFQTEILSMDLTGQRSGTFQTEIVSMDLAGRVGGPGWKPRTAQDPAACPATPWLGGFFLVSRRNHLYTNENRRRTCGP